MWTNSTQQFILVMLEEWKNFVFKSDVFGAWLIDLSKAFDWHDRELLTTNWMHIVLVCLH